jgi:hypothetical protein
MVFLSNAALVCSASQPVDVIAQSNAWLALIHYEKSLFGQAKPQVKSSAFYLDQSANPNPLNELKATLKAFRTEPNIQCHFPARRLFLRRFNFSFPSTHCEQYEQYIKGIATDSVSVVYASGYLGNPASMYGHIFLKFGKQNNSDLLDDTFNYGARYPENENGLVYIFKGIFGGYKGYFVNQKYHHQTLTYSDSELRDLWEYRLNYSKDDIELMLAHLFELEGMAKTYYFFGKNCAYQIAKLLELASDETFIPQSKAWTMPIDVITRMSEVNKGQLIKNVTFHGSRQEQLFTKYSQLTLSEKKALRQLINLPDTHIAEYLNTIDAKRANRLISVMYDYFAFLDKKHDGLNGEQTNRRNKLVDARLSLPVGKPSFYDSNPKPPTIAQKTSLVQFSGIALKNDHDAVELRYRANYYDFLNINAARVPFSELSTLDLRIRLNNSKLYLEEATLLKITNLNASLTGLPEDSGLAWKAATGYKTKQIGIEAPGSFYMEGFIGKSTLINTNFALYGAIAGTLWSKNEAGGNIVAGPEVGGVSHISPSLSIAFKMGYNFHVNDSELSRVVYSIESRFLNFKHIDIRTAIERNLGTEAKVSFSYYY